MTKVKIIKFWVFCNKFKNKKHLLKGRILSGSRMKIILEISFNRLGNKLITWNRLSNKMKLKCNKLFSKMNNSINRHWDLKRSAYRNLKYWKEMIVSLGSQK